MEKSDLEVLERKLASLKAEMGLAPQKVNIYNGYRNDEWYEVILKDQTVEQAYDTIIENLKHPTFSYEKDCALRVYEKMYGVKFQSKERSTIDELAAENARLKAELVAKQAVAKLEVIPEPHVDEPLDENDILEEEHAIAFADFPKGMNKAEFRTYYFAWFEKSQGGKPAPVVWGRAWKKYNPENENPA